MIKNDYYKKMLDDIITKVWENEVKKPAQYLTFNEYCKYIGSRDFYIKLKKDIGVILRNEH